MEFQPFNQNWTSTVIVQGRHSLHGGKYHIQVDLTKPKRNQPKLCFVLHSKSHTISNSRFILISFWHCWTIDVKQLIQTNWFPIWSMVYNTPTKNYWSNCGQGRHGTPSDKWTYPAIAKRKRYTDSWIGQRFKSCKVEHSAASMSAKVFAIAISRLDDKIEWSKERNPRKIKWIVHSSKGNAIWMP